MNNGTFTLRHAPLAILDYALCAVADGLAAELRGAPAVYRMEPISETPLPFSLMRLLLLHIDSLRGLVRQYQLILESEHLGDPDPF